METSGVILEMSAMGQESYSQPGTVKAFASFTLHGKRLVVEEVIDYWQGPRHEYLKLLAEDERIYLLRRIEGSRWEVEKIYSY